MFADELTSIGGSAISLTKIKSPGKEKKFVFPTHIPECGGDGRIERIPGQAAYRCVDRNSFALQKQKLHLK